MKSQRIVAPSSVQEPTRVLAWWDVDVHIPNFTARKRTARPLKELERALGHRLHVEGCDRYDSFPNDVWKFEARNYFQTSDPAWAAYSMLLRLSRITTCVQMSWQGFNRSADAHAADFDQSTICAFYWRPPDQIGLTRYMSSGVLLSLIDCRASFGDQWRLNAARPVVYVDDPPAERADYVIEFIVHIVCGNKQDLLSFHWPRFQSSQWPDGVDSFEVDARIHAGKPNIIRVRKTIRLALEHTAVAYCLTYAPGFRITLKRDEPFSLEGERGVGTADAVYAFKMTRL